jgi:hypothetical protein
MGHSCGTAYRNYLSAYSKTLFTPAAPKEEEPEPKLIITTDTIVEDILPTPTMESDLEKEIKKLKKIISIQSNTIKEQQEIITLLTK